MKRNVIKVLIGIMFISLCLILYVTNTTSLKHTGTLDLTGGNDLWKVILNVHLQYDSELIIEPGSDNFKIPPKISIDIIVNNNCVYTDRLEYIPSSNKKFLGKYMVKIDSDDIIPDDYFKKNNSKVYVVIKFNDQSSSILLTSKTK